jgi:hypothetical protein
MNQVTGMRQTTTGEEEQERARFYARLASISALEELHRREREVLEEDLHRAVESLAKTVSSPKARVPKSLWKSLPTQPQIDPATLIWEHDGLLHDLHRIARNWIGGLIDAGFAYQIKDDFPERTWVRHGDKVHQNVSTPDTWKHFVLDLERLVTAERFPFRRCPVCKAIFVRVKRQKYCSPGCAYRERMTTGREERRAYMKDYMAERRKNKRKKKREA